jgi:hypothetical protein
VAVVRLTRTGGGPVAGFSFASHGALDRIAIHRSFLIQRKVCGDVEGDAAAVDGSLQRTRLARPLWQPLCYAHTFITLLLVPVLYSIFVLDLKIVKWEGSTEKHKPEYAGVPAVKGELN